jgi:hypothetical protein
MVRELVVKYIGRLRPAAIVMSTLAVTGCGALGVFGTSSSGTGAAAGGQAPASVVAAGAGHTDQAGACIDGTGSSASFYARRFQSQVAAAVAGWATKPLATLGEGAPGTPGLHIVVRSVTTTSNSTDYPSVNDTIPAVATLTPAPAATDPNYPADLRAWLDAKPAWQHAASAALAKSQAVADEVRRYSVARNTYSAVFS